ncbi:hypothetical protein AMTRI_Chr07g81590 [Amborella trichopoda]
MLHMHTVQTTSLCALISGLAKDCTADLAAGLRGKSICEDASMALSSWRFSISIGWYSPSKMYPSCEESSINWRNSNSVAVSSISFSRISATIISSSCWRASVSVSGPGCSPSTISLSYLISIKKRNCTFMLGSWQEIASTRA